MPADIDISDYVGTAPPLLTTCALLILTVLDTHATRAQHISRVWASTTLND